MEEVIFKPIEEANQAKVEEIWEYAFGFTPMAVLKCAIELQIADVLESHGGAMTDTDLSTAVGCSLPLLRRIMRYLTHRRFFKQTLLTYMQPPLSKLLMKTGENSMAALILLQTSPAIIAPWHKLSSGALENGALPFEAEHGRNLWDYNSENPEQSKLFNDGMACVARQSIEAFIHGYPDAFNGIRTLVDVGGGDGTALRSVVKAFPWIRGINFDLPHVVSVAPQFDGIQHVAGNVFDIVPKADAAFIMWVLHDWDDEECIHILKKCREAIPQDTGKVIIAEAVIGEGDEEYRDVRLALDMVMLAHTEKGKERTYDEWEYVVKAAGFTTFTVTNIKAIVSVIEAYP